MKFDRLPTFYLFNDNPRVPINGGNVIDPDITI